MTNTIYDGWASLYDRVYSYLEHDIPFYIQQAISNEAAVLELGSGTGRISVPIGKSGFEITGIDISGEMVKVANIKAMNAQISETCHFHQGDMRTFELKEQFGLIIMPFRSFQSMLTVENQQKALSNIKKHLQPGGVLVMDLVAPDVELIALGDPMPFHVRDVPQEDTGHKLIIWGQNSWNGLTQVNSTRLIIHEVDQHGEVISQIYRDFPIRYTFRYEMEHLLHRSGFQPVALYGGFNGEPFEEGSEDQVWISKIP